ncbi:MAG: hypothetical protein RIR11_4761 [Bacteroidota bacterium]
MPVSTLNRRSFLSGKKSEGQFPMTKTSKRGEAHFLLPFTDQELPDVPAPNETLTFLSGLAPYTGPWGKAEAAHLLRRTCFGVKKTQLDQLKSMTVDSAVAQILAPTPTPPVPVNDYNGPDYTDPVIPAGESWVNAPYLGEAEGYRIESWRGWWYQLILNQEANVLERMTMFWHNHFSTQTEIVYWGRAIYDYNTKLRAKALGNFKSLVKDITLDGTMLLYLNGYLNTKGAPDENYGRELQELFTIGKDNPDHYTEDDVVAAARVLTGWKINFDDNTAFHYPLDHDFEDKQFSSFYNNTIIQGSINGEEELDNMLNMIFAKNEVAEYICRKIYRWFVYYNISAEAEQNVIQPLATIFRNNNYEIKPVMEALLKSEHFYETMQSGCFVKTPVDIVLGTMRSYNVEIPSTTTWDSFTLRYILTYFMSEMRMLPGDPPNVAGWQAFRQTPQYYRLWINGDTLRLRNLFTDAMTAFYFESDNDKMSFDLLAFTASLSNPSDPNAVVDEVTDLLLSQPLSAAKKYLLKTILLSGLPNDSYWTNAWDDYTNNPNDDMAKEVVYTRLRNFHLYFTRLPEFQLA